MENDFENFIDSLKVVVDDYGDNLNNVIVKCELPNSLIKAYYDCTLIDFCKLKELQYSKFDLERYEVLKVFLENVNTIMDYLSSSNCIFCKRKYNCKNMNSAFCSYCVNFGEFEWDE